MTIKVNKKALIICIFSIVIFYACMNVTYINELLHINSKFTLILRIFSIFILLLLNYAKSKKLKFSTSFILVSIWFFLIVMATIINRGDIVYTINNISRPYLICMFCDYFKSEQKKIVIILETWKVILLLLCVLDLLSIIYFPNGLYKENYYTINWFLGYKTARVVYTLPLAFLTCYLSHIKKGYISLSSYAVVILCVLGAYFSQATAGATSLLVYLVFILIMEISKGFKRIEIIFYKYINFKSIFLCYSIIFGIMMMETNSFIQFIVQEVFGKSSTLSNRTIIWENCISKILENPIFGNGYLTTSEYVNITQFYLGASPHNLILSIILTNGIIGLVVYLWLISKSLNKKNKIYTCSDLSIIFAIIASLITGLTSSTLVFSVFSYLPFLLLSYDYKKEKNI